MTRRQASSLIALVAAYAIALQAVFAGLILGARTGEAALMMAGGLCLTGQPENAPAPADRMPCCSLAACCPAGADAAPVSEAPVILARAPGRSIALQLSDADAVGAIAQRPQQPRAPPAA
jgi:hypothetical protein